MSLLSFLKFKIVENISGNSVKKITVLQTATGGQIIYIKAIKRTICKELCKLTL